MDKSHKSYTIQYTKSAEKFFCTHEHVRKQYINAVDELMNGTHPEKVDVMKVKGKRYNYYRIRLGEHRIIYTVIRQNIVVINTLLAGTRGDIYKKMDGLK